MTFINEKISEEDKEKYGISEINRKASVVDVGSQWTIDKEKNVYLRRMHDDREVHNHVEFNLFWKGSLLIILLKYDFEWDGLNPVRKASKTWSIISFAGLSTFALPNTLEKYREEITVDLKEALTAYGEYGIYSKIPDYTVNFDF